MVDGGTASKRIVTRGDASVLQVDPRTGNLGFTETSTGATFHWGTGLLFPFDHVEEYLRQAVKFVHRDGSRLKWPSWEGEAELTLEPADYRTPDGYVVSEVVTLSQTCSALDGLNAAGLSHLNSLATTAAVVRREASGPICFVAKVGIFSADKDAAENVYAQLICMTAVTIGWHVTMLSADVSKT